MFKINLRDFSKRDLLFKDPVRATTPANPLLGGISNMNDPAVISRQFEAANYDIGRVMADGLRSTLS